MRQGENKGERGANVSHRQGEVALVHPLVIFLCLEILIFYDLNKLSNKIDPSTPDNRGSINLSG